MIEDLRPVSLHDIAVPSEELSEGVMPVTYTSVSPGVRQVIEGAVVDEVLACISVNGTELTRYMCSPHQLPQLALGFLFNEGLIDAIDSVQSVHVSKKRTCVDIWLKNQELELPDKPIVTAGCGGGVTFDDLSGKHEPLNSHRSVRATELSLLMRELLVGATRYRQARGIHTAALACDGELILQVEDVGRHNCLDRLAGAALASSTETCDQILLSSGRISSEMINKARRLQTPIVCSRTSPTSLSVALAEAWNITLVAYLRQDRMRVYTYPERVISS
ncbi:MAG: formate dehydrogenase accessory sulfurtransferase FdhD [Candidatus Promineifilaceae bacterium]